MSEGATLIGNRFQLGNIIGMGGMATVYKAIDTLTGETVAIKLLKEDIILQDPDIVARFDREGEALRRLNHPNIVKILATVVEGDKHYVVMEFVGGGDLSSLIQDHRQNATPIPIQRILEIALDLSDALTRAHRLKIIHRDIKPANVLIAEDGTPRLTDFGVAHFSDSTKMTQTGALIGTLAYLSPEACSGEPLDGRADIWSFGVMMYELLALRRPFDESNTAALLIAILNKTPTPINQLRPDIPPQLTYLIDEMLAKDPEDRIASARLVGAQLEAIISGGNTWDMPIADFEANLEDMADFSVSTPSSMRLNDYKIPPSVDHGEFVPDSAIKTDTINPTTPPPTTLATSKKGMNPLILIGGLIGMIALILIGVIALSNITDPATNVDERPILLDPVDPRHLMVIVGGFENIGGESRDVGRFIYEDLQKKFERDVPFSRIQVGLYPDVIGNSQQAEQIAQANQAAVIIWGNYDEQGVRANVQIGSLVPFNNYILTISETRRFTDVQAELTDERRESLAVNILAILNVAQTYNNNPYEIGRNLAILELVNTGSVIQMTGNSIATHWHRYFASYNADEQASLLEINQAIRLDTGVPFLYSARALTYARLRQFDNMIQDIRTAQSISPDNFWAADMLLAQYYFMIAEEPNLDEAIAITQDYLNDIPDNWWINTMLGGIYWQQNDLENAQPILEQAITLAPDANYPYVMLISIYMRQSELGKAQTLINFVRQNFPDATISNRILSATYALDGVGLTYASETFAYFILGQWNNVLEVIERANFDDTYTDAYALAGLAECNLRNYEQAEAYYTRVLDEYPDYWLVYLLRAEVRLKQENAGGALADIALISQSDMAERFAPLIAQAQRGELSCETILEVDFSDF